MALRSSIGEAKTRITPKLSGEGRVYFLNELRKDVGIDKVPEKDKRFCIYLSYEYGHNRCETSIARSEWSARSSTLADLLFFFAFINIIFVCNVAECC